MTKITKMMVFVLVGLLLLGTMVSAAEEEITLKVWDWSDNEVDWLAKIIDQYESQNPNITIQHDSFSIPRYNEMIPMVVRSGEAPDIHGTGSALQLSTLVEMGWFQPMDPYIEELYPGGVEAFKGRFTDTSFVEGINVFDGHIYTLPKYKAVGTPGGVLLFYNKDIFKEAGLDPERPPKTWGELREYAKKITDAGNGDYYGFIMGGKQNNRWSGILGSLAKVAGAAGRVDPTTLNGFNFKTGKYEFEADNMVKAVEFFKSMYNDGSFFPGFEALNALNARARFGAGEAGFIIQGKWCIRNWRNDNPDLDFGIAFLPVPDEGRGGYISKSPDASLAWALGLSSQSKHPKEAMEFLIYRTSDEAFASYNELGVNISPVPAANTEDNIDPYMYQIDQLAQVNTKTIPLPVVENPAASIVIGKMKTVSPTYEEVLQGSFMGMMDYTTAAKRLSEQMNKELDRAIKEAQNEGVDVSREDFTFPDWNPLENY